MAQIGTMKIKTPPVTDGLVAHYKMDSGSGSTAVDSAGSNDGTINGATWSSSAKQGSHCLSFSGGDYVSTPVNISDYSGSGFTVCAWAKPDENSDYKTIVGSRSGGQFYLRADADNRWDFGTYDGSTTYDVRGPTISTTEFTHVAGVYDGSDYHLYVNGELVGTTTGTFFTNSYNEWIGEENSSNSESFVGEIDDVRIYDRPLSSKEVRRLYHKSPGGGVVDVPVFDTGDVSYSALRVQTSNGIGAVNLVDPSNADIDFVRFQTPNGVKAVKSTAKWRFEDNFTSDTTSNYTWNLEDGYSTPSYSYDSSNDGVQINSDNNAAVEMVRSFTGLAENGYLKIVYDIQTDYPSGENCTVKVRDGSGSSYAISHKDESYHDILEKVVNGTSTDKWSQSGTSSHNQRTVELWWSPDSLKAAFNGSTVWDVTTSDGTAVNPSEVSARYYQADTLIKSLYIESW